MKAIEEHDIIKVNKKNIACVKGKQQRVIFM